MSEIEELKLKLIRAEQALDISNRMLDAEIELRKATQEKLLEFARAAQKTDMNHLRLSCGDGG